MKRAFVLLPVVGAVSLVTWMGCGGSTTDAFTSPDMTDGGSGGSTSEGGTGASGTTGNAGSSGGASTVEGGVSFDPGMIGGLISAGMDGGAAATDAGNLGGGVITPAVVDGCNALCAKEAALNCPNQGTIGDCIVGCRLYSEQPEMRGTVDRAVCLRKEQPRRVRCAGQSNPDRLRCRAAQRGFLLLAERDRSHAERPVHHVLLQHCYRQMRERRSCGLRYRMPGGRQLHSGLQHVLEAVCGVRFDRDDHLQRGRQSQRRRLRSAGARLLVLHRWGRGQHRRRRSVSSTDTTIW